MLFQFNAKFLLSMIGIFVWGFPGMIIGLVVGHFYDNGTIHNLLSKVGLAKPRPTVQQIYFRVTFQMMGYIAKSDGHVSQREITMAQTLMRRMNLSPTQEKQAIEFFNQGKSPSFNWVAAVNQLRTRCWMRPGLMKTFAEMQLNIALADGLESPEKRQVIQQMCRSLGMFNFNINTFEQRYRAQQNYSRNGGASSGNPFRSRLSEAYTILGVKSTDEHPVVKKAYRKLMSENHPDRLIAKGVPEDMVKLATEKTQTIKQAYEDICAAKGWSKV